MAELLLLFWIFFKIGLFTFGGGYAMIPLIREELVGGGFITEELLRDFIGISESTPGPFAVNMATFIGMDNAGLIGAFFATFGVVLPSFLILLLIARFGSKVLDQNDRFVRFSWYDLVWCHSIGGCDEKNVTYGNCFVGNVPYGMRTKTVDEHRHRL